MDGMLSCGRVFKACALEMEFRGSLETRCENSAEACWGKAAQRRSNQARNWYIPCRHGLQSHCKLLRVCLLSCCQCTVQPTCSILDYVIMRCKFCLAGQRRSLQLGLITKQSIHGISSNFKETHACRPGPSSSTFHDTYKAPHSLCNSSPESAMRRAHFTTQTLAHQDVTALPDTLSMAPTQHHLGI